MTWQASQYKSYIYNCVCTNEGREERHRVSTGAHTRRILAQGGKALCSVFFPFKCKAKMVYLCSGLLQLVVFTSEVKKKKA